ncbi:hypothetical protein R1sor_006340 [Riccia sorocarpa]|uniref:Uncharacterized protein n=1 Tax=Riccia sorocarpa TaxID=122646 RepID=A0ABD3HTK7_9MARC
MVVLIRKRIRPAQQQQRRLLVIAGIFSLVALSMLGISIAYLYTPRRITPCGLVGSHLCVDSKYPPPTPPYRTYSDEEVASFAVTKDILSQPRTFTGGTPKIAFMFLTPGPLPFEFVWEAFFKGHEGQYTVYVHASERDSLRNMWRSRVFQGRDIPSGKVYWGTIEMIDAERRLLSRALLDLNNQVFVLLSDTCVPLRDFNYVYNSLINSSFSFVDNFDDPGPHGLGRYIEEKMVPEVQPYEWRKGAQWFAIHRRHAILLASDYLYYQKFRDHCRIGEENHNCYPDEHYVQTYLHMVDPGGLSNWTVTHVDWSEGGWHPRSYGEKDVTVDLLRHLQSIDEHVHVTSDAAATVTTVPCLWEGVHRPCFLFARKFLPETAEVLADWYPSEENRDNTSTAASEIENSYRSNCPQRLQLTEEDCKDSTRNKVVSSQFPFPFRS